MDLEENINKLQFGMIAASVFISKLGDTFLSSKLFLLVLFSVFPFVVYFAPLDGLLIDNIAIINLLSIVKYLI